MKETELWMKKLKEKLEDYSEPIPPSGWEQLEKELMPSIEKKIHTYRKWTMVAAAAVLLAIVSSVSLYFLGTPAADDIRHIQTPALASSPDVLPGSPQPDLNNTVIEPVLHPSTKERLAKTERKTSVSLPVAIPENKYAPEDVKQGDVRVEEKNVTQEKPIVDERQSAKPVVGEQPKPKSRRPSGKDKLHIPTEKREGKKGIWSTGLSVGNSGGAATTAVGGGMSSYMSRVSMASVSNGMVQIPNDQALVFEEGVPYLRQVQNVTDIKHHQPLSFGLSVRKSLKKGFSLETGLTYTLLSSDAKLVDSEQNVEQKLHYLGIPLRANWSFLDKKIFTLYVSGGGMIEKCVYGKLGTEKETVKPFQFSLSGAVGAQLNATKKVGIYVEPGVAYFFNDGSGVQTIRKENPLNFNIQAGIRLTY